MSLRKFLTRHSTTTPAFLPIVLLFVLILLALTGCAVKPPPAPDLDPTRVEITQFVWYQCGQPPGVTHVSFDEVEFKLVEIEGQVVWTLSAQQYANLGNNMSDIILASKEMKGERDFWRACVTDSIARWSEANETP